MRFWLAGFVGGALLGAICESQTLMFGLCGFLAFAAMLFKNNGVFCVLGLIWGAYYNPNTTPPQKSLLMVEEHVFSFQQDSLIARLGANRYAIFGRSKGGSVGTAHCFGDKKLFFQTCFFREKQKRKNLRTRESIFQSVDESISRVLGQKLNPFGRFWRGWFEAVALGKKTHLAPSLTELFRGAGLLHLLVISGFHVSLVAGTVLLLIRLPFQIAYVSGLLKPEGWRRLHVPLLLVSSCIAVFFASYVGMTGACQRALLFFLLRRWWPVFLGGGTTLAEKVLWTATIQSFLFPIGFFSTGNILSWGAFLLVLPLGFLAKSSWKEKILVLFKTEIQIMFLCLALIGKVTAVSVWANLILAPLFPIVFFPALFWIAIPNMEEVQTLTEGVLWLQKVYVHIVESFFEAGSSLFAEAHTWSASLFWRSMTLILLIPAYVVSWSKLGRRKALNEEEEACYPSRIIKEHLWNVPGKANLLLLLKTMMRQGDRSNHSIQK